MSALLATRFELETKIYPIVSGSAERDAYGEPAISNARTDETCLVDVTGRYEE